MFPTFVDLLFAFSFVTRYVSGYALPAPKTLGLGDLAARTADAVEPTITPKPHQKRFMAYPYAGIWQNYKQHGGDISTPIHVEPAFVVAGKNYNNTCMLWNDKCDGNRNQALVEFFNESMPALMADNCFAEPSQKFECFYACSTCTKQCFSCPASSASNWNQIRSFLRGPSISSAYSEAIDLGAAAGAPLMYAPCDVCGIGGPNVDVYYWPSPSANTSCLSIIGSTIRDLAAGATTTTSNGLTRTYWGYVAKTTNPVYGSVVITAELTTINGITVRMNNNNPWAPQGLLPGQPQSGAYDHITVSSTASGAATVRANPIPLQISPKPSPLTKNASTPTGKASATESTLVYKGHTFTSPSIYVDFYSLSATDSCGLLGPVITSTLLSFAPGELSTIGQPIANLNDDFNLGHYLLTNIQPFNFADLPCPPYSVMYDQWYEPGPGQPYRPLILLPSKVKSINSLWKTCSTGLFIGLDPPRALDAEQFLLPSEATAAADGGFLLLPPAALPKRGLEIGPTRTSPPAKNTAPPGSAVS